MQYTRLGRSGLRVSRLCLGTMNFGQHTDEQESFRIMDRALDAGITFFDTANIYGGDGSRGKTEEIIGRWLAQGGGRRERVVIATKVYGSMEDPLDGPNGAAGLSAYKINRHLEGSLRRLGTDRVDLYQMHHVDRVASWDELWEVFDTLIRQGKICYVGSSNFAGWHLAIASCEARRRNMLGLVSEQHRYSLVCRAPELEVLPAALALGIGVIAWSPLGEGLLGGRSHEAAAGTRRLAEGIPALAKKRADQLAAFGALCRELGLAMPLVSLAWILSNPALTAPIIGPRSLDQLEGLLEAPNVRLDARTLGRIDEIFPGPGGPAPEAYSW
jgi:aryl-alcohol dehydrogenase-like predicted oxidoreductase